MFGVWCGANDKLLLLRRGLLGDDALFCGENKLSGRKQKRQTSQKVVLLFF